MAKVDGVDGASNNDMSTTDAANAITINTTNLSFLYINGNINIHHVEKLECWRDLPILRTCLVGNCSKADIEISKKKGVSFKMRPKIKNIPYSSGIINKLGGLSKPVSHGEINLNIKPLGENKKINPTAIVICGKAKRGAIISLI